MTGLNIFTETLEKEEKKVLSQRLLLGAQQLDLNRQNSLRYDEQSKDPGQSLLLKARKQTAADAPVTPTVPFATLL